MQVDTFLRQLMSQGFHPFMGVPCSLVKDLINLIEQSSETEYYIATSEGEAVGLAGGFALAGRTPVVIMQNDGFGNTVNPLTSLQMLYNLPALLIITWRGEPGGKPDAAQHSIMGAVLLDLLKTLNIPYQVLHDDHADTDMVLLAAMKHCNEMHQPYAIIVRRGLFESQPINKNQTNPDLPLRMDYIKALATKADEADIILGTTGYTGRELKQVIQRPGTFYTAGSMGCLGSIGLALAIDQSKRKVYILDGDGALLMKLGTLATIGLYQPSNLIHLVFDNGQYESTGGQSTASQVVQFPALATSAGYRYTVSVDSIAAFDEFLEHASTETGPMMCHIRVQPGTIPDLQRPSQSPDQLRAELREFLLS
jgi:phosphonopyruvate decarboxylase